MRVRRRPQISAQGRAKKQAMKHPAWKVMTMLLERVLTPSEVRLVRPNWSLNAGRARVPPRKALS